ncbi:2686_t:CDS:1, partial [Paraglomus occultum]
AGIPLEETRNSTLKETEPLSLIVHPPICDRWGDYPAPTNSFCRDMTTVAYVCDSRDNPYHIVEVPCRPGKSCIEFVFPGRPTQFAACINNEDSRRWDNRGNSHLACENDGYSYGQDTDVMWIGMTTYNDIYPMDVNVLSGSIGADSLGIAFNQNHFGAIYKNYRGGQKIKMCFDSGSLFITALTVALVPRSGSNNEFTVVSLNKSLNS